MTISADMTPEKYKTIIGEFGLTQEGAGIFFGGSPRQGQRWASGEKPVPIGVAIALILMKQAGKEPKDFRIEALTPAPKKAKAKKTKKAASPVRAGVRK